MLSEITVLSPKTNNKGGGNEWLKRIIISSALNIDALVDALHIQD